MGDLSDLGHLGDFGILATVAAFKFSRGLPSEREALGALRPMFSARKALGQASFTPQLAHAGRCAKHTRRPWKISTWLSWSHCSRGNSAMRSGSILSGGGVLGPTKSLRDALHVGVDHDPFGRVEGHAQHHVGGLASDPGSSTSSRKVRGTSPRCSPISFCREPNDVLGLLAKHADAVQELLDVVLWARASDAGSGYAAKRRGVTLLTRTSVVCAERTVATRSSNGLRCSSSQCASGCSTTSRLKVAGAMPLAAFFR